MTHQCGHMYEVQILHRDQTRREEISIGSAMPPVGPGPRDVVSRILTRDLFAIANFLVAYRSRQFVS